MRGTVVILGGGDHARVVKEAAELLGLEVAGFVTVRRGHAGDTKIHDLPVLAHLESLDQLDEDGWTFVSGVGSNEERKSHHTILRAGGRALATIVHPGGVVSPSAGLGPGTFIAAGAVVGTGARLGEGVIVNTGATVDHDCILGDYCQLGPGVHLNGRVTLKRGVLVGVGAVIVQGVTVGEDSTIGAGSVVLKDIPRAVTAWGAPARIRKAGPATFDHD